MQYRLIVDSCCELTPALREQLQAQRVALQMTLGEQNFIDDETLDLEVFLREMKSYKGKVQSSCPPPFAFLEACRPDVVNVIVTLSSKLSGSHGCAKMAQQMALEQGLEVHVIDSKSACADQTLVAMKIAALAGAGRPVRELVAQTEAFVDQMHTFFVLERLDNLMKNGRMSKITGTLATMMKIHPVLGSDGKGEIAVFGKARGSEKAIKRLIRLIGEQCADTKGKNLVITHCDNAEQADNLSRLVKKKYAFDHIEILTAGGLSSLYADHGGIVIAF